MVNSIGGELDVDDLGFESARFGPRNRYTTVPLVINQAQLDWPHHEGFSLQANREHKQESRARNLIIANRIEAKYKGVQVLITKGLIDTVVTNKNGDPDSQQKNLTLQ